MKRISQVLYQDLYMPTYEEYVEDCEINEREVCEEGSEDFYEFVNRRRYWDWECLRDDLKYSDQANCECVVVGHLGLWHGRYEHESKKYDDVLSAIEGCIRGLDAYVEIRQVNGHIEVEVAHHDGTNSHEIYLLNDKGLRAGSEANLSLRCYHKAINGYIY